MSPSLQQAHHHPPDGSPFQPQSGASVRPNIRQQLQNVTDQTPKKDILVVQGDKSTKVGNDAHENWQSICGPFCYEETNERGLGLQELATFNDLVLANTFGHHKTSRRVRKRFRSGANIGTIRAFPGADIGSVHDLVMMTSRTPGFL